MNKNDVNAQRFSNQEPVHNLADWLREVSISTASDSDLIKARDFAVFAATPYLGKSGTDKSNAFLALAEIFEGELSRRHERERFEKTIQASAASAQRSADHSMYALIALIAVGVVQALATLKAANMSLLSIFS